VTNARPPFDSTPLATARPLLERRDLPWLGLALLVAVAARVAWILYVTVDPNGGPLNDSVFYHNAARLLAEGHGYVMPLSWIDATVVVNQTGEPTAAWPPGYPALLAVVYKAFGWNVLPAKLLNVGFAAATVVLVYIVAKRLFDSRVAAAGALALAVFPGQVYFATLLMTETLFAMLFMLTFSLVLIWTLEREARGWQVALVGAIVGYSALVRAEGLLLTAIIVPLWLAVVRPWGRLRQHVLLLVAGIALVLLPWTVRNAVELHRFVLIRDNANWALSAGLDPGFSEERLQNIKYVFEPPQPPLGEVLSHWATHPWELGPFAYEKLRILYKNDADGIYLVQTLRAYLSERGADAWSLLANVYFFTLGALALAGAALSLLSGRKGAIALVWFGVGWSLIFVAFIPTVRYHFPVGPPIAILGSLTIVVIWDATLGRMRLSKANARTRGRPAAAGGEPSALRR
jgi:4-amino-4-deoxy-L-arabinose transferase-like glycosyltransferase